MALHTTGIDHVNLQVNDLEESIRFWTDLLGFEILESIPDQNGAIIGTREAKLALYEKTSPGKVEISGLSHLGFHIEDFDSALADCQHRGIPILYDGVVSWPNSRSLYIQDPNGYEVELTEEWGGERV